MPLLNFDTSKMPKGKSASFFKGNKPLNLILGIGALVAVIGFGSTLAANINIGTGPIEVGQGVAQTTSCDHNILVTPYSTFVNATGGGEFKFSRLELSSLDSTASIAGSLEGCEGKTFTIKLYAENGDIVGSTYAITANGDSFLSPDGDFINVDLSDKTNSSATLVLDNQNVSARSIYRITVETTVHSGGMNHYFDNQLIRMGSEDQNGGVNSSGMPREIYFYNTKNTSGLSGARALTNGEDFSLGIAIGSVYAALACESYGSGEAITVDGYCTDWDNGDNDPAVIVGNTTYDYSGVFEVPGGPGYTYGTIITTTSVNIAGYDLQVRNRFTLGRTASFIKVTTRIKNVGSGTVTDLRAWGTVGDQMVGDDHSDIYLGNVSSSGYNDIDAGTQSGANANAVEAETDYGQAILYSSTTNGAISWNGCCQLYDLYNVAPVDAPAFMSNVDGSYALTFNLHNLAPGASHEFTWMFGGTSNSTNSLAAAMFAARIPDSYTP